AGMPLITKADTALANFVKENNVGLVVNRQSDCVDAISQVSDAAYQQMANNMQDWAQVVRTGGCLTATLATALNKLNNDKRRVSNNAD
uniref:hypothetical protein n=1 Tax=Bartonella sp. CL63NXGY TaxID=3243538 RepID=UPI0035D0EFB4